MTQFYIKTKTHLLQLLAICLMVWIPSRNISAQACVCTNCPQFMPDNFVGDFLINVMGATNNTLGQNGQGVCGVNIHFDHEYLGDLSIVLTSPAGQSVTLVGPIGLFGGTDFTEWNVSFVPCGDVANPDPGFSAQWNNNQAWGLFGNYTGSYYPFSGCLEGFNSGPVNGTWTLTVTDGQAIDVGNFFNYEIIFCDPSGINCFSCAADAGNLTQADVTACQGSPNLNLNLPPTYPPPTVEPPSSDYSYTYVISGAGGVILAYDAGPDLTGYDPGTYNICGLSYLSAQANLIPDPDGSLTMTQLTNQLASNQPPFCGDISGNCVGVTINGSPPDEEEDQIICAPSCYIFHNQTYCQSGTYVRNLTSPQGCPYTATLHLTVLQPSIKNIIETVCAGECSSTPGFESECSPGAYQQKFVNAAGCDSIVNLNLQVLAVVANIVPPGDLSCIQQSLQLFGTGSSTGASVTYHWTASNGGHISGNPNTINTFIDAPGDYQLLVCKSGAGITCCDSAQVTVISTAMPPPPPASIAGPTPICQGQSASYTATTVVDATSYVWTVPAGVTINSGQNTQTINVTWNSASGGNVCASSKNNCGTSAPTCLAVSVTPALTPTVPMGADSVCAGATTNYSIPPLTGATNYTWTVTGGTIASGQGSPSVVVDWGASNGSICVNATGACGVSADSCLSVTVTSIPAIPVITGSGQGCPGHNGAYSVAPAPGATIYNWQITNGFVAMGQGSNGIQATWNNNALSGIVCVNAGNGCGVSPDTCLNVDLSIPVAGQITTSCDPTNLFYTVSFPITGGTPPYSVPGGTLSGNVFTSDPIPSGQPYSFFIDDANLCVSAEIAGSFNCNCTTSAGAMDLNPLSACEGQMVTAHHLGGAIFDGNDVASYILHTNPGTSLGTVLSQNSTGVFGMGAGMSFETTYYISYVVGNNQGGNPDLTDQCLSVAQGQPAVFHQIPVADAGLDADTCGLTMTLQGNAGIGVGTWALVSTPGTGVLDFSGTQNPNSSVTASEYGAYSLSWTLDNSGCTDADSVSLDFNDNPLATAVVETCDATNVNFTVGFQINGGAPGYTVGGAPAGTVTGNSFLSDPTPNGSSYNFVITDSEGCVSAPVSGNHSCNCSTKAGLMDVSVLSACEGAGINTVYLGGENLDANDTGSFFLHSGSGNTLGTVYAQNNTGAFGFQTGMTYGVTYYVSYVAGDDLNGIPDTTDACLSVSVGQPVVFYQNPVADAGVDQGSCGMDITLQAVNPAGALGQWTITGGSAAAISVNEPINPNSSVTSTQTGVYTLTWSLTQNGCMGADDVQIEFFESPTLGNLQRTCDLANEHFTVTLDISGGAAPYSVNSTPITGSTFVSAPFDNGQSYQFDVVDANGCTMPAVTGAYSCNCSTGAGTMAQATLTACEGQSITVIANSDQLLDANDVTSYVLHNGAGQSLGLVFAQNQTGVFTLQTGMMLGVTYYVSLAAGNPLGNFPDPTDPCFSVAAGQPVMWIENPTADAGEDDGICGLDGFLQAQGSGFDGLWTLVSGPGVANIAAASDPVSPINVTVAGSYQFRWTEDNNGCMASDVVDIDFWSVPEITEFAETCDGANTTYYVTFTVNGGTEPFIVVGLDGNFSGTDFVSDPLDNGASYTFGLVDDNGCPSESFSGAKNCECSTDAGTMQISPLVLCANTPASVTWNNDGNSDADDIVRFILHSTADASKGTIFATNTQPTFSFGAGLQVGVTYYISAIAGSALGNNIDLNDPCLSIAPGVPVQWKPMPTATLSGDATICAGSSTVLSFSGAGTYPLTVNYLENGAAKNVTLNGNQTVTLNLTPTATTTYTLVDVADGSQPTCLTTLNTVVTVTVNQPVDAGEANEPVQLCEGVALPIVLSNLITGGDLGGKWSETSAVPSTGGAFNANIGSFQTDGQAPGTYTFRYLLSAQPPCPSDESTVTVIIHPLPTADAGEDKAINCDQIAVTLGGLGTSTGTYEWTSGTLVVGDTKQIIVSEPGEYTLQVTNPAGCTDDDAANVMLDNEKPVVEKITVISERCYGEKNGSISVDSVTSAHYPVQYALNGGTFQNSPVFRDLPPGDYTVSLMDANGCESSSAVLTVEAAVELLANLGDLIEVELGDSVHLVLDAGLPISDLDTIVWNPLLDLSDPRVPNEQHFLPLQSWVVRAMVTDQKGCEAESKVQVRVSKPRNIYVPNIFNPEGIKDPILYIYGGKDVAEIESFHIFDRWGTMIFEQKGFQPNSSDFGWDGRFKGDLMNPGVFVYQAVVRFIDGEKILFKGDVTLIR